MRGKEKQEKDSQSVGTSRSGRTYTLSFGTIQSHLQCLSSFAPHSVRGMCPEHPQWVLFLSLSLSNLVWWASSLAHKLKQSCRESFPSAQHITLSPLCLCISVCVVSPSISVCCYRIIHSLIFGPKTDVTHRISSKLFDFSDTFTFFWIVTLHSSTWNNNALAFTQPCCQCVYYMWLSILITSL